MLPIGNLTMFLSVPPSYQYLHSPFTIHHSLFTIHISPIHQSLIYHSLIHHHISPFTHSLIQSFTIHYSLFTITHSLIHHSFILPLFFWSSSEKHPLSEEHPKDYRTTSEGKWKRGGQIWSNVDKSGQTWTNVDKYGQT
jgi:hypothetical protein